MPLTNQFPAGLNSFPNPTDTTKRNAPGFELHEVITQLQDAGESYEAAIGATAAATDHLDYVRLHDGTDKGLYVPAASLLGLNPIVNPAFDIWQDGVTFTSIAADTWGPDGWLYGKVGAGVHDLLRSTDVPTVAQAHKVNYSLHLDVTTADASIAAGDVYFVSARIEGYNWKRLAEKQWSLRFWVKAAKTGVHYVAARNSGNDRSCVIAYTVNVADTWEEKQVTFPASPSAGTWNYTNLRGLDLAWTLACGSTFQTTAGAWQTGNFLGASDQVNEMDNVANNFRIALIGRPTLGPNALPFQAPDIQTEELRCKRYNEVLGGTAAFEPFGAGQWYAATTAYAVIDMVPKRAAPSVGTTGTPGDYSFLTSGAGSTPVTTGPATFLGGVSPAKALVSGTASGGTATAGQATSLVATNTTARLKLTSRIP